ncbi:hypothetical protein ACERK3_14190 [Phycisphaerales bacterium AB-hyl4]|uniref:Uncharacterized protein n=1 Tax=Natronomicrosphaera hydrolytica TaxID=3242702 RepID=A0ABV4U766_9BACT
MGAREQRTGIAATISIIAAIGSYVTTCAGHPIWGFVLALVSIPLGVVGLVISASPRVTGGMISIAAIVLGGLGLIVAIFGMLGVLVT